MLTEKNNTQIVKEKIALNNIDLCKIEEKNVKVKKTKKKSLKRFSMEKTVDETISKINLLLENEVNYIINLYINIFYSIWIQTNLNHYIMY